MHKNIIHLLYNSHVMNRHEYRVKVVFALYQSLLLNKDINKSFDDNFSDEEKVDYINVIENDLILNKDNYIQEISSHLRKWTFDRLSYLEQAILLVACSEIKKEVASKSIVIDEAIRIAKEYCDEKSYQYINGVLDNL